MTLEGCSFNKRQEISHMHGAGGCHTKIQEVIFIEYSPGVLYLLCKIAVIINSYQITTTLLLHTIINGK